MQIMNKSGIRGYYRAVKMDVRGLRGSGPDGSVQFEDMWEGGPGGWRPKYPDRVTFDHTSKNKILKRGLDKMLSELTEGSSALHHPDIVDDNVAACFTAFILVADVPRDGSTYPADAKVLWNESDGQYNINIPPGPAPHTPGQGRRGIRNDDTVGPGLKRISTAHVTTNPYRELEYVFFAQANVPLFATGQVVVQDGATVVDGATIQLDDGINPALTFEFDSNASVAAWDGDPLNNIPIVFGGGDTQAQVRDKTVAKINEILDDREGSGYLFITAVAGAGGDVDLTHDKGGEIGNTTITVAGAGLAKTDFTGGSDGGLETADDGIDNLPIKAIGMAEEVDCGNTEPNSHWGSRSILGVAPTHQGKSDKSYVHEGTNLHKYVTTETMGGVGLEGYVVSTENAETLRTITADALDVIDAADDSVYLENGDLTKNDEGRELDAVGSTVTPATPFTIQTVITKKRAILVENVTVGDTGPWTQTDINEPNTGDKCFDGDVTSEGSSGSLKFGEIDLGFRWRSATGGGPHHVGRAWLTAKTIIGVRIIIPAGVNIDNVPDKFDIEYLPDGGAGTNPFDDAWSVVAGESYASGQAAGLFNAGEKGVEYIFASPQAGIRGIRLAALDASVAADFATVAELHIFEAITNISFSNDSIRFRVDGVNWIQKNLGDVASTDNMQLFADAINAAVRGYGVEATLDSFGHLLFRGTVAGDNSVLELDSEANGSTINTKTGLTGAGGSSETGVTQVVRKFPTDAETFIVRFNNSGDLPLP